MADIPFQIGGHTLPCPDFDKSDFSELGDIEYQYLDGSPVYLGMPSLTLFWPLITTENVQIIRALYDTLVTGFSPTSTSGTPISLTIPDYSNSGLRTVTAYMVEPTGTAGGDTTRDFKVGFTNLHEGAFLTAIATPDGNLWESENVEVGAAQYISTGWQF